MEKRSMEWLLVASVLPRLVMAQPIGIDSTINSTYKVQKNLISNGFCCDAPVPHAIYSFRRKCNRDMQQTLW